MSFLQDFSHRAILPATKPVVKPKQKVVARVPVFSQRIVKKQNYSPVVIKRMFTNQAPRGPFPPVPVISGDWPTLLNTGPGAIGRTTFIQFSTLYGVNPILTSADYSNFPTDGNGYHLIEGYDMVNTGGIFFDNSDHWRIRGCKLYGSPSGGGGYGMFFGPSVVVNSSIVEYCSVSGTDNLPFSTIPAQTGGVNIGINAGNAHILEIKFNQIYHFATAISQPNDNCSIHDNFIANPRDPGGGATPDHTDGIITHGSLNLTIDHNWIDNRNNQTDCIDLTGPGAPGNGVHTNVKVTNNFMALNGVGFCLYGGSASGGGGPVTGGVFTGNRFSNKYGQPFSSYITNEPSVANGDTNITWSDNRETDAAGTVNNGTIVG